MGVEFSALLVRWVNEPAASPDCSQFAQRSRRRGVSEILGGAAVGAIPSAPHPHREGQAACAVERLAVFTNQETGALECMAGESGIAFGSPRRSTYLRREQRSEDVYPAAKNSTRLGVSQGRASQIRQQALARLRSELHCIGIRSAAAAY